MFMSRRIIHVYNILTSATPFPEVMTMFGKGKVGVRFLYGYNLCIELAFGV